MELKIFGPSGLRVSRLCLGAMTFGTAFDWGADKTASRDVFNAYLDAGGNFIDTANRYQATQSESFLGEFTQGIRDRLVLATKYTLRLDPTDPNSGGNHRKSLVTSLEASLKRLQTDYVDILWMHCWDQTTRSDEVMRALEYVVASGKALHIAISDSPSWIVARSNAIAELRGWSSFTGVQLPYSLIERSPEREALPMAKALGLGVTAFGCLGSGVLTGKYLKNDSDAGRINAKDWPLADLARVDRTQAIARKVAECAAALGVSAAQIALAWVMARDESYIPIIGARTVEQVRDNLGALDVRLPAEMMAELDALSAIPLDYPHSVLQRIATAGTAMHAKA